MTDTQASELTDGSQQYSRSVQWIAPLVLAWLLLPAWQIAERDTGASRVLALIAMTVFGGCFILVALTMAEKITVHSPTLTWLCIAVMAGLTVAMPLRYPHISWTCLQAYFTISLTFAMPLRLVPSGIAAGVLLAALQDSVFSNTTGEHASSKLTLVGLGLAAYGIRRSRDLVQRLQAAQGQVARLAAAEERLRIARDLHDLVGHSLSLIVVKSELAGRLAEAHPQAAAREIADVESVARQSLVQVRDAVTGYRQRSLLEELDGARSALAAADVQAIVRVPGTSLPDGVDPLLGWVVREGVINVIRHAQATRCQITVALDEHAVTLDIVDDGRGPSGGQDEGNGLAGLAERVTTVGGRIESGARTGQRGFRLAVRVPVPLRPPHQDDTAEHPGEELAER